MRRGRNRDAASDYAIDATRPPQGFRPVAGAPDWRSVSAAHEGRDGGETRA